MSTVEITRMEDVRVGDDITLTRDGLTVSGRDIEAWLVKRAARLTDTTEETTT